MTGLPSSTHIQDALRSGCTLEELTQRYALKVSRHGNHPNLVHLRYDQINSPMGEPLVRECRAIVLDEAHNWECVCRGFDKFFNYGEPLAAQIDWTTARVEEKVDGTLCLLYHYAGEWHVATTGTADASGAVWGHRGTFADLFWEAARRCGRPGFEGNLEERYTYLFELTTPHNRVVIPHKESRVTLLAVRVPNNGRWLTDPEVFMEAHDLGFCYVTRYFLNSIEEIRATFGDTIDREGYVVVDAQHNRVKVKHPLYVALHHMKGNASPKRFLEVIRKGESTEMLSYFPELEREFTNMRDCYDALCDMVDKGYARLRDIDSQKDFAIAAQGTLCPAALFQIRKGSAQNAREFFAGCHENLLLRALGISEQ